MTTTLFAMLSQGAHVVVTDDAYRRTRQFLTQTLHRYGVEVSVVPAGDYERLEEAIRPTTRLLFSESPTNPYNRILDLERFADIGRRHRVKTVIDATFATPYQPAAARVRHRPRASTRPPSTWAATTTCWPARCWARRTRRCAIRDLQGITGAVLDPFAAYLLIRGIKTLALRMERQNENAQRLAEFLAGPSRRSTRVHYAGLPSHPEHAIAGARCAASAAWCRSRSRGDLAAGLALVDACRIPRIAPSLGGVESLIEQPALMSFYELTTEERLQVGIKDNLDPLLRRHRGRRRSDRRPRRRAGEDLGGLFVWHDGKYFTKVTKHLDPSW